MMTSQLHHTAHHRFVTAARLSEVQNDCSQPFPEIRSTGLVVL